MIKMLKFLGVGLIIFDVRVVDKCINSLINKRLGMDCRMADGKRLIGRGMDHEKHEEHEE